MVYVIWMLSIVPRPDPVFPRFIFTSYWRLSVFLIFGDSEATTPHLFGLSACGRKEIILRVIRHTDDSGLRRNSNTFTFGSVIVHNVPFLLYGVLPETCQYEPVCCVNDPDDLCDGDIFYLNETKPRT